MRFICQVSLPPALQHGGQKMAYIFMTAEDDDLHDRTWEPESGENAVVLQPASFDCLVKTSSSATGPTLQARVEKLPSLWNKLSGRRPGSSLSDVELGVSEVEVPDDPDGAGNGCHIGGEPVWLQDEETPAGDYDLIIQIDAVTKAYEVNFGDGGVGYAFIRRDGRAARFLWQCG